MISHPPTITIPLQADVYGIIRISGTRVTLDTVIARYHQGDSPETIHNSFDVLPLNDIYAIIAYYLAHQDEINNYLNRRKEESKLTRQKVEANDTSEQRARHDRFRELAEEKHREQDT